MNNLNKSIYKIRKNKRHEEKLLFNFENNRECQ